MDKPTNIWVTWPTPNGAGLAFSTKALTAKPRTEYILSSHVDSLIAAARDEERNRISRLAAEAESHSGTLFEFSMILALRTEDATPKEAKTDG